MASNTLSTPTLKELSELRKAVQEETHHQTLQEEEIEKLMGVLCKVSSHCASTHEGMSVDQIQELIRAAQTELPEVATRRAEFEAQFQVKMTEYIQAHTPSSLVEMLLEQENSLVEVRKELAERNQLLVSSQQEETDEVVALTEQLTQAPFFEREVHMVESMQTPPTQAHTLLSPPSTPGYGTPYNNAQPPAQYSQDTINNNISQMQRNLAAFDMQVQARLAAANIPDPPFKADSEMVAAAGNGHMNVPQQIQAQNHVNPPTGSVESRDSPDWLLQRLQHSYRNGVLNERRRLEPAATDGMNIRRRLHENDFAFVERNMAVVELGDKTAHYGSAKTDMMIFKDSKQPARDQEYCRARYGFNLAVLHKFADSKLFIDVANWHYNVIRARDALHFQQHFQQLKDLLEKNVLRNGRQIQEFLVYNSEAVDLVRLLRQEHSRVYMIHRARVRQLKLSQTQGSAQTQEQLQNQQDAQTQGQAPIRIQTPGVHIQTQNVQIQTGQVQIQTLQNQTTPVQMNFNDRTEWPGFP